MTNELQCSQCGKRWKDTSDIKYAEVTEHNIPKYTLFITNCYTVTKRTVILCWHCYILFRREGG